MKIKNPEMPFVVVGIGELLWDLLPDGKQLGGAVTNFAFHAQALGGQGIIVSSVGSDELGKEILTQIEELDLESRYLSVDNQHPTGTVTVELDEDGKPSYIIHENVAWDFIPFSTELDTLANSADAVCFGSLAQRNEFSRKSIYSFLKETTSETLKIFDINLRQNFYSDIIIKDSLDIANILKINDEELPVLSKILEINLTDEVEIIATIANQCNLDMVVLTKGENGSLLYANGVTSWHSGHKTKIIDTVGAGDAFTAAVAIGVLNKLPLDEINESANKLAAYVCSQAGGTPVMPDTVISKQVIIE